MTFREMHQDRSEAVNKMEQRRKDNWEAVNQRRKDNWEAVNKALYALIVGHAAGLVACMTFLKDYNTASPGPLKGVGTFITLFGVGLFLAIVSAVVWIVGRYNYWVFPFTVTSGWRITATPSQWDIPHNKRDWWTAALALISAFLMALASLIAVCKFGTL
jgi:hypothetical protein